MTLAGAATEEKGTPGRLCEGQRFHEAQEMSPPRNEKKRKGSVSGYPGVLSIKRQSRNGKIWFGNICGRGYQP